jgi:hypothetical protein
MPTNDNSDVLIAREVAVYSIYPVNKQYCKSLKMTLSERHNKRQSAE